MRNLTLCAAMLLICAVSVNAQDTAPLTEPNYNKQKIFASLPETFKVNISSLMELLAKPNGEAISSDLGADNRFDFAGQVVSVTSKYNNTIQTVVVRSSNFNGARLTFTRTVLEDGSISYSGRIISFDHGDVYEMRLKDGSYEFIKKNFHQLVNE